MAVNGVAEAFVNATASQAELDALATAMMALAALYIPAAAAALRLGGSTGLVLANCANMACRIAYAQGFIRRTVAALPPPAAAAAPAEAPLRLLPRLWVLTALAAAFVLTGGSRLLLGTPEASHAQQVAHVGVGAACLMGVGMAVLKAEPELLVAMRSARKRHVD